MKDSITIKKGLNLPIEGAPDQWIETGREVASVALLGNDYVGMRPSLAVAEGDAVKLGQTLFVDRKRPDIRYVSPASGKVRAVQRGAKRRFLSVVIDIEGNDREQFPGYGLSVLEGIPEEDLRQNLIRSGLWTVLRTRPYNRVPDPGDRFLGTHPANAERVEAVRRTAAGL